MPTWFALARPARRIVRSTGRSTSMCIPSRRPERVVAVSGSAYLPNIGNVLRQVRQYRLRRNPTPSAYSVSTRIS
jgi:hypothetical protein